MRSSIFTRNQIGRACAFCRQHQHHRQQRITLTRNLRTSSTQQQQQPRAASSPLTSQPRSRLHNISIATTTTSRSVSTSRAAQTSQADTSAATQAKVPQTHYEFFPKTLPAGPPPHGPFAIDVRALRREFLGLQAGAHPDLHPSHMKARAQAASARINEAFKTLESPLARAQYILSLRGCDVAGDETAKVEDPELLMQVLETRECIEEAREEGDLEALRVENEERIAECEDRLQELFARDSIDEARAETVRLRYWVNVRESINNWEKGKPVVLEH
ncbi:Co-chaperone Hsc20 [Xylaria digitata]|nr:Co-chaperone Hsc20 [Xylaria digitata]